MFVVCLWCVCGVVSARHVRRRLEALFLVCVGWYWLGGDVRLWGHRRGWLLDSEPVSPSLLEDERFVGVVGPLGEWLAPLQVSEPNTRAALYCAPLAAASYPG